MKLLSCFLMLLFFLKLNLKAQQPAKYFTPIDFSHVVVTDHFWKPKIDLVATKSLQACIYQTEIATPRIQNFINAAKHSGKFIGLVYDDSDVYKALEAMGYSLKNHPDTAIENTADRWINYVAAAQMPDGYLDTYYQLRDISKRWTELGNHEDYNAGHLMEAAVAYYDATGKRKLLDVAIKLANHIDTTMRINNRAWFSGHEEIEIGLMKLYHVTGNQNYEKLANWYLNQRGKHIYTYQKNEWVKPDYWQDVMPVKDQTQITGHAVRAMYLYSGTADVAAATGDEGYMNAMKKVWEDVVYRNMYLTGGIGPSGDNEGFSKDYDLPNESAYCETCASVGMVLWNERMNELTGDAKYIDVLERSLYNGALDGLSLSGDHFFYDNPLASNGQHQRSEWFGTACCPANISRLVAGIGNYIYGANDKSLWVNLFIGSNTSAKINNTNVDVNMQTNYPWDGKVSISLSPEKSTEFDVYIRIPGWTQNNIVGDLYFVKNETKQTPQFFVNGKAIEFKEQDGYAVITNKWKKGDVISFEYKMPVLEVSSKKEVLYDNDRVALQRGPIVYCVEGADNNGKAWNLIFKPNETIETTEYKILNEPVVALQTKATILQPSADGSSLQSTEKTITAIPYYTWCNRGKNEMQVWLPTKMKEIKVNY
jgi:DUF1680 family protein